MMRQVFGRTVGIVAFMMIFWAPRQALGQSEKPLVMAAVGDSISTGFNARHPLNNQKLSWTTGDNKDHLVVSHYFRLTERFDNVVAYNFAKIGSQARQVVEQMEKLQGTLKKGELDYLTVMVGANDVCMWPDNHAVYLKRFKNNIRKTLRMARDVSPKVKVLLAPVPDMRRLYEIGKVKGCSWKWRVYPFCAPLFRADGEEARSAFSARTRDLNHALEEVAAEESDIALYARGLEEIQFNESHLSSLDCFHPSVKGQQTISDATWHNGWYH